MEAWSVFGFRLWTFRMLKTFPARFTARAYSFLRIPVASSGSTVLIQAMRDSLLRGCRLCRRPMIAATIQKHVFGGYSSPPQHRLHEADLREYVQYRLCFAMSCAVGSVHEGPSI